MLFRKFGHLAFSALVFASCVVYQRPDLKTDLTVPAPFYTKDRMPLILFDTGHGEFHDPAGTYRPFALLMEHDGIHLQTRSGWFTSENLRDLQVLIIANATADESGSAFTEAEIAALRSYVQQGGGLLLIADHDPFGSAAAPLAAAFGVRMASVWTVDSLRWNPAISRPTWLEYSRNNGGLQPHPILQWDSPDRAVRRVLTFTGQSLDIDSAWTPILKLSSAARDYTQRSDAAACTQDRSAWSPASGRCQLAARTYGRGRIVISGEAALFTSQEVRIFFKTLHAGFNTPGYDDKQLVLNIMHWLLGDLQASAAFTVGKDGPAIEKEGKAAEGGKMPFQIGKATAFEKD